MKSMASHHFETLFTWDTVLSADSTEWCPLPPFQSVFVCGTYQVEQAEDYKQEGEESSPTISRHGTINVFNISCTEKLEPHQVLHVPAILDTKWCNTRVSGKVLLATATATGELNIYQLKENLFLQELASCRLESESLGEVLALSLDWSWAQVSEDDLGVNEIHVVVSDSKGCIHLFSLGSCFSLKCLKVWHGHEYEAWISAFNYMEPTTLFSGGDDCTLKGWDTRRGMDSPTFINKSHGAGVTSLHCNSHHEHAMASGSYDENLRLWDLRFMKQPLKTADLQGGVWRLKWDPHSHQYLMAACMYGGFNVVNTKGNSDEPTIVAKYKNHESIAYGADWSHLSVEHLTTFTAQDLPITAEDQDKTLVSLVSTCSFYDHRLCISLIKPKES